MARITFTSEQLAQSKSVVPGWYPLIVKSYEQTQASTDGSDNHVYMIRVLGDSPFKGVEVRLSANEKWYPGEFIEFLEVTQGEIKPGVPVEFEKSVGKSGFEGFIQLKEPKGGGRAQNTFVGFRKSKNKENPQEVSTRGPQS